MLVRNVMRRDVVTVGPMVPLVEAARRMRDRDVNCIAVVEAGTIVGMLSDRDIVVRGLSDGMEPNHATVRDVMSSGVLWIHPDASVEEAHRIMYQNRIKQLPVVDQRGRVMGLIGLDEVSESFPKCRPHRAVFYKRLAGSAGQVRDVEVGKVYLSPAVDREQRAGIAIARFERDHGGSSWKASADTFHVDEDD